MAFAPRADIVIGLPLNHDLIGRLTASRLPTATLALALRRLDHEGFLARIVDSSWRLALSGIDTFD